MGHNLNENTYSASAEWQERDYNNYRDWANTQRDVAKMKGGAFEDPGYGGQVKEDDDRLGAVETLNLIDQLHPTKNSPEDYREAVKEIKNLAIEAIKEGRL